MEQLRLVALDLEDLDVLSANLQDAVLKVGDMTYLAREKRFVALLNRFDWQAALKAEADGKWFPKYRRCQTALRFERVLAAKCSRLDLKAKDQVLELLAIQFAPRDGEGKDPEGEIELIFAGGPAIRLHVECIEAELRDLGPSWPTANCPHHDDIGPIEVASGRNRAAAGDEPTSG